MTAKILTLRWRPKTDAPGECDPPWLDDEPLVDVAEMISVAHLTDQQMTFACLHMLLGALGVLADDKATLASLEGMREELLRRIRR